MYQKIKFKNGLRLITAPLKETKAVTVLVLFKVGSRHESAPIAGASHFIEHLMFKGTKKRPSTLAIARELDGVGAEYNAFTAKDHTGYYIKIQEEKLELAIEVLADLIFNSKFDPKEMDRERQVIVEEINLYEDNPLLYIEDLFEGTVFGSTDPLGRLISGSKETVKKLSRQELLKYKNLFYEPGRMLITVAGAFDQKKVRHLVTKYFLKKQKAVGTKEFTPFKETQKAPQLKLEYKETAQVQLCLGFPAISYFDKRLPALNLLAIILGGNMSSRLFIAIRERRSLCYFIKSSVNVYEETGDFVIQAGLDKERIREAIKAILAELRSVKLKGVKEHELKKAKDFLRGKITLDLEDSESIAAWYSRQELLTRKTLTPLEKLKEIDRVSLKEIKQVAEDLFLTQKLNLTLIGPFKDIKEFLRLLRLD